MTEENGDQHLCLDKEGKIVANGFAVVFSKVLYHFDNRSYFLKSTENEEKGWVFFGGGGVIIYVIMIAAYCIKYN